MPVTLASAFALSALEFADRIAVRQKDGVDITYRELADRVGSAIAILRNLRCEPGDRIAIWLPNRVEWPVFTYAAALLGLCVVPINTRYRPAELVHALRLGQAKFLVTQERFLTNPFVEMLREVGGGRIGMGTTPEIDSLPDLREIILVNGPEVPGTRSYPALLRAVMPERDLASLATKRDPSDPMWLLWTSGTTSAPKGALLPQSVVENIWKWTQIAGYRTEDRVLATRPLFYIAGHFWAMIGPMLYGATSVLEELFTPEETIEQTAANQVTVLSGSPLFLKHIIESPEFDPAAFSHVRVGYFGGSSMPLQEMQAIKAAIGFEHLIQVYGMTELGGYVLSTERSNPIEAACASIGKPLTDVELRLVDPETGETVPDGAVGALVTRGQKLLRYIGLNETDLGKYYTPDGWFRTGDLMRRLPDGSYQFVGRAKDLIKVGGENVTASEIESILMSHPEINLAVVVGVPDVRRGEVPVAFIEPVAQKRLSPDDLRDWCRSRMAPYKVPSRFDLVERQDWPMTSSGKIAKHELQRRL